MNYLIKVCQRYGILDSDMDYHVIRASMVLIFLFFGYQKWFEYEAQALIPYISNGPLLFWMYPVFGVRGACWFLGVSEWTFGILLFIGFWNKTAGVLGTLGGIASFVCTTTIIPFIHGAAGFASLSISPRARAGMCCPSIRARRTCKGCWGSGVIVAGIMLRQLELVPRRLYRSLVSLTTAEA